MVQQNNTLERLKLTLVRSLAGRLPNHKACANGLGLRRVNQAVTVENTACNLGMIRKIAFLLKIEQIK